MPGTRMMKLLSGASGVWRRQADSTTDRARGYRSVKLFVTRGFRQILKLNLRFSVARVAPPPVFVEQRLMQVNALKCRSYLPRCDPKERSEERRVGKERKSRWEWAQDNKTT